jgi:hypothetical protein
LALVGAQGLGLRELWLRGLGWLRARPPAHSDAKLAPFHLDDDVLVRRPDDTVPPITNGYDGANADAGNLTRSEIGSTSSDVDDLDRDASPGLSSRTVRERQQSDQCPAE